MQQVELPRFGNILRFPAGGWQAYAGYRLAGSCLCLCSRGSLRIFPTLNESVIRILGDTTLICLNPFYIVDKPKS